MAEFKKTLEVLEKQKDTLKYTEYACTNLEFMVSMGNMTGHFLEEELITSNRELTRKGNTSSDAGHNHVFIVNSNGNGIAKEACHPQFPNICHTHKIVNWIIQSAESKSIDEQNGAPNHIHNISSKETTAPITTARPIREETTTTTRMGRSISIEPMPSPAPRMGPTDGGGSGY